MFFSCFKDNFKKYGIFVHKCGRVFSVSERPSIRDLRFRRRWKCGCWPLGHDAIQSWRCVRMFSGNASPLLLNWEHVECLLVSIFIPKETKEFLRLTIIILTNYTHWSEWGCRLRQLLARRSKYNFMVSNAYRKANNSSTALLWQRYNY